MDLEKDYKRLPGSDNHYCFGCSPANPAGLHMEFYTNGSSVVSPIKVSRHLCGWDRLVHGGILSTILDEIMSWAAIYLLNRVTLTKSMTIDFLKPMYVGQDLQARATVVEVKGRNEALMEGTLMNGDGIVCARSTGRLAIFSPEVARRLGIANEEHLKWFDEVFRT